MEGWPAVGEWLSQAGITASPAPPPPANGYAVLLSTGSHNPMHRGHVGMLHAAAEALLTAGYAVLGAWISPTHDDYVQDKAARKGTVGFSSHFRLAMAECSVQDDSLVSVAYWEATRTEFFDFPEVAEAASDYLRQHLQLQDMAVTTFYVCGSDHFNGCRYSMVAMAAAGIGVVVVPREGEEVDSVEGEELVIFAAPCAGDVAGYSSTKVREAIERNDHAFIAAAMSPRAADLLLMPTSEELQRFESDYAKVGITSAMRRITSGGTETATGRPPQAIPDREVFISASALAKAWSSAVEQGKIDELRARLEAGLLFLGSKKMWLFPENEEQEKESCRQGSYFAPSFPEGLKALIAQKLATSPPEVHFLKPPELNYTGFPDGCHPPDSSAPAFHRVSDWLTSHGYNKLILDSSWWLDGGYNARKSGYGVPGYRVVENYETGEHDYDPCMELLWSSDQRLRPQLQPCL